MEQLISPYIYPLLAIHKMNIDPDMIISQVANAYGIDVQKLYKKSRLREIVEPRAVILYLLRKNGMTYMKTGNIFNLDHATVIYHYKRVIELLQVDKAFRKRTEGLI